MAVSFPTSPSSGDTYDVGRIRYEWSGSAWTQIASQPVSTGAEIPFIKTDGSTSDPIKLASTVIGDALVNDTTPQLGGDLDINGNDIVSDSGNENINITPHGTGSVVLSKVDIGGGAIDGTIIGAASTAAISGTTGTFSGAVTGATLVGTISTAAQNSITSASSLATVGTITAGAWQSSTVVASAYLDADTAHLGVVQTFTANKTFTGTVTVGVNGTGKDVIFYGDTGSSNLTWDESADDLIFNNAGIAVGSDAEGDIYYRDSSGFLARLGKGSDGQVLTSTGTLPNWEASASGGIASVVADTTPQLGGSLDVNSQSIVSVSNGNILVTPNGTGHAKVTGLQVLGDTAAGDDAAMGYTSADGLILTGQGSTNDVVIKNDADAIALRVATGTQFIAVGLDNAAVPVHPLVVTGTKNSTTIPSTGGVSIHDTTSMAEGVGGILQFTGNQTGTSLTTAASIHAYKSNGIAGNYSFDLVFNNRTGGGDNTEKMRITSTGNLGIGTGAGKPVYGRCNVHGLHSPFSSGIGATSFFASSSDAASGKLNKGGGIQFGGIYNSSSDVTQWAGIGGYAENNTDGNVAGYLMFMTRAAGSAPAERMRIASTGMISMGTTGTGYGLNLSHNGANAAFQAGQGHVSGVAVQAYTSNASYTGKCIFSFAEKSAAQTYNHIWCQDGLGEIVWRADGAGYTYADNAYSSAGADYGEFFESTDASALGQGVSVVLVEGKVRLYDASDDTTDDIIGVVRPKGAQCESGFVGNSANSRWQNKYLTDEWGVYVFEDVTLWEWDEIKELVYTDDDDLPEGVSVGDIKVEGRKLGCVYEARELAKDPDWTPPDDAREVSQSERILNPEFDPDQEYVPRDERDEWNLIGVLGQVQIKAGEATNPRWIKMKDISEAVEMWMIR